MTLLATAVQRLRRGFVRFSTYLYLRFAVRHRGKGVATIIFSRDRPLQLQALLASLTRHVAGLNECSVLYSVSNSAYAAAYAELSAEFPGIKFFREDDFRRDLIQLLSNCFSRQLFFLVDDIIFTDSVNFAALEEIDFRRFVLSLRLHPNVRFSYTRSEPQIPPPLADGPNGLKVFSWQKSGIDWAYPLSVDGHVFVRDEIFFMIRRIAFKAPNSLESGLQVFSDIFRRIKKGLCFEQAKLVNFAVNRVQTEYGNLHGDMHQDSLLELWKKGFRVDIRQYERLSYTSVHSDKRLELSRNV